LLHPSNPRVACDDQLGDAISTGNQKVLLPVIDEEDAYFSAVIGIDGPWGIYHPDTVL
jgi:hypothetical protein